MLQNIFLEMIPFGAWIHLKCPSCAADNQMGLPRFVFASKGEEFITCVACKKEFYVQVFCQTRAAELPLERKSGTCPSCGGKGYHTDIMSRMKCEMCKGTGHV